MGNTGATRWVVVVLGGSIAATAMAVVERDHLDDPRVRVLASDRVDVDGRGIDDQAAVVAALLRQWREEGYGLHVSLARLPGVGRPVEDVWRDALPRPTPVVGLTVPSLDPADPWRADLVGSVHIALSRGQVDVVDDTVSRVLTDWTTTRAVAYDSGDSPVPGDPTGRALPVALALHHSHPDRQARIYSAVGYRIPRTPWPDPYPRIRAGGRLGLHSTEPVVADIADIYRAAELRYRYGR